MIAFAGAKRLEALRLTKQTNTQDYSFSVRPRWDLAELMTP